MAKREYIQANKEWLEAKAKEEGVKALPKGIYYKVLSERHLLQGAERGQSRECKANGPQYHHSPLYRQNYRW